MISLKNVSKTYLLGHKKITALNKITLNIKAGEFIALVGHSGSGKSTLLHIIGGLDSVTSGQIIYDKTNLADYNDRQLAAYRSQHIGFVFQDFYLFPHLNLLENITLPQLFSAKKTNLDLEKTLNEVDLKNRQNHYPHQLSGGEKQRLCLARALINKPDIVLADEPTGNLDDWNAAKILSLMKKINHEYKTTFIIATHDAQIANLADRVINLKDGKVSEQVST